MEISKENKDKLEKLPQKEQKQILSLFYNFCLKQEIEKQLG